MSKEMTNKQMAEICLRYLDKGYSSEDLRDGDDLYHSDDGEKDWCVDMFYELQSIGSIEFSKKYLS